MLKEAKWGRVQKLRFLSLRPVLSFRAGNFNKEIFHFPIPPARRLGELRGGHPGDAPLQEMIGIVEQEIEVFRRFPQTYGYVFYVMKG